MASKPLHEEIRRIIREEEPPKPSTRLSELSRVGSAHHAAQNGGQSPPYGLASVSAQRHTEPAKLTKLVRGELDWIVMKALEKDRTRRYETANGFAMDVERYLADEPVLACPPSAAYRFRKFARRNKAALLTTAAVAAGLVLGTLVSTWQAIRATTAENLAHTRLVAEANARAGEAEQRRSAEAAAEAEKKAKEMSEARESEIKAVLDFVENQILAAARPLGQDRGLGRDVTLRQAIESALPFVEESFVDEPLIEARLRATMGASYLYLGDGKTAETQFERARDIRAASLGPDHADSLLAANGLGASYYLQGRYREALELQKKTLEIQTAKLGADHADTLRSMANVATDLGALGRRDEAIRLLEATHELQSAKLGPDHADTLRSMSNLSLYYSAAGRHAEALKLSEEAVQRRSAKYGPEHAVTLNSMRNLAMSYAAVGRHVDALNLREETLRLRKEKLGLDHPDTLVSMADVADSYHALGRHADAMQLREETMPQMKARFGAAGYETLGLMNDLAQSYSTLGRDEEAAKVRDEMRQAMTAGHRRARESAAPDP